MSNELADLKQVYCLIQKLSSDTNSEVYITSRDDNLVFKFQRNNLFVQRVITRRERELYIPMDYITGQVNHKFKETISHEGVKERL